MSRAPAGASGPEAPSSPLSEPELAGSFREKALLAAILLLALGLRLWKLGGLCLDVDEHFDIYHALKPSSLAQAIAFARGNPTHLLLGPLLDFFAGRFSSSLAFLRLVPALTGTAGVYLLYRLGRRAGGARTGLIAAALLAASMLDIEWSRRVNFYAALVFWTLCSVETLFWALEGGGPWAFLPYFLTQTAFLYAHPYAVAVALLETVWAAVYYRRKLGALALSLAAAGLAFLPWFFYSESALLNGGLFRYQETWHFKSLAALILRSWAQTPEQTTALGSTGPFESLDGAAWMYGALFLLGLLSLWKKKKWSPAWALAAAWAPAGLAIVLLLDWRFSVLFAPRQTLWLLPFFLLLAARGIEDTLDGARAFGGQAERWMGFGLWWLLLTFFLKAYTADLKTLLAVQDFRTAAAASTRAKAKPGDILFFHDPDTAEDFLYSYDRRAFLEAEPPRRIDGFYRFRLPMELWVDSGSVRNRAYCLIGYGETPEQTRERWLEIARQMKSGGQTIYLNFYEPNPRPFLERFLSVTGLRPF